MDLVATFIRVSTIAVLFWGFLAGHVVAKEVIIKHRFFDGTLTIIVDDERINPETLKRYLVVHPIVYDSSYHVGSFLTLCVEDDPKYFPCGERDYTSEYFLKNAKVNLEIDFESLRYLHSLTELKELQPLVQYFIDSLEFGLWLDERKFLYYQTWNTDVLREHYKLLGGSREIQEALRKLDRAKTKQEKWRISRYDWHKAFNRPYRNKEGQTPRDEWNDCVHKYGISESIEWDPRD